MIGSSGGACAGSFLFLEEVWAKSWTVLRRLPCCHMRSSLGYAASASPDVVLMFVSTNVGGHRCVRRVRQGVRGEGAQLVAGCAADIRIRAG